MARQAKITRRGKSGVWYARIFIPADLQAHFGVEDKKVSLRTTDEGKAKVAFSREMVKWNEIFHDLRSRRGLTSHDRAIAVWEHYESTLQRDDKKRKAMPSPADIAAEEDKVMRRIERGESSSENFVDMINAHTELETTLNQARRDIGTFVQYVGESFPASSIDKKAVREWKALLQKYPVKATETTAFKGMDIVQTIKHNETVGKPALSPRTVNRYCDHFKVASSRFPRDPNPAFGHGVLSVEALVRWIF